MEDLEPLGGTALPLDAVGVVDGIDDGKLVSGLDPPAVVALHHLACRPGVMSPLVSFQAPHEIVDPKPVVWEAADKREFGQDLEPGAARKEPQLLSQVAVDLGVEGPADGERTRRVADFGVDVAE